jgi:hypothetical protein
MTLTSKRSAIYTYTVSLEKMSTKKGERNDERSEREKGKEYRRKDGRK